jgi:tol-pal system protein YbgF
MDFARRMNLARPRWGWIAAPFGRAKGMTPMKGCPSAVTHRLPLGTLVPRPVTHGIALSSLVVCACWFPQDRGQRLEQRVDRIEKEEPVQLEQDRAATQEAAKRVDAKLAEVQKALDELEATTQQAEREKASRRDKLAEEVAGLHTLLDQHGRRLEAIEKTLAELRSAAGSRVAEGGAGTKPHPKGRTAPERPRKEVAAAGEPPAAHDTTGVLALAREQESKGQIGVARELYQEYVAKFPNEPAAAEAHFRLGELAFGERRYQEAIVEFGTVAKNFPSSDRAPAALLRTADSMIQLGMKTEAASVLSEIPKRYPNTAAAARARQRLPELTGTGANR